MPSTPFNWIGIGYTALIFLRFDKQLPGARNLSQAMMIMLLILQPMLFLSGAWNPPEAMNPWMRKLSIISPMRYFIDFGFGVLLKGNGLSLVAWDIAGIVVFGVALFSFSLWWFQRSIAR